MRNQNFNKKKMSIENCELLHIMYYVGVCLYVWGDTMITYKNLWNMMELRNLTKTEL